MTPAVSVIVPTYNYARFLPAALDSALGQTFRDFEALVIDDGSTDDTPEVVRPYLADPRVRYHRVANGGPARARNVGLGLARAPLVAFLDADDLWLPAKLERQVALFRRDPGLGLVYTRRRLMDEEGCDLDCGEPAPHRGDVLRALLACNFLCLATCMLRREVFTAVGTFDETLKQSEDFDLWLRIAERYRFDYVDEQLVRYRVGHASISRHVEERLRTVVLILRRFQERRGRQAPLPRALLRSKLAGVYSDFALQLRDRSRWRALSCYARALWTCPGHGPAWLGVGSLFLPERARRLLRRALGRPVDWRVRRRARADAALGAWR
jgi:glycosyltransferase involved in cell wall biosynthesis